MASALSNRQNCACARKALQTQRGRTHGAGCVRQWFLTAEPLEERHYENWNTHRLRYLKSKHGCPDMRLNILLCAFLVFFFSFLSPFCKYMDKVKVKIWVLRPFQEYFAYIEPIINQRWAKTGVPIVLS